MRAYPAARFGVYIDPGAANWWVRLESQTFVISALSGGDMPCSARGIRCEDGR